MHVHIRLLGGFEVRIDGQALNTAELYRPVSGVIQLEIKVPEGEMKNVARVFDQARKDSHGFEPYARQVAGMFADTPEVLEDLLHCLAFIARADGDMHADEIAYLKAVSDIFGLDNHAFEPATSRMPIIALADLFGRGGPGRAGLR